MSQTQTKRARASQTPHLVKRELGSLLRTPTAYLYLVIFSLLTSLLVLGVSDFYARNQADLAPLFEAMPWLALLLTPAITMGLWSEELRSGSIELLFTLPIGTGRAVLEKFLAAWGFTGIALVSTSTFAMSVYSLGDPDRGAMLAGYIGAFLLMGAFVALGSFVSTVTRSQSTAFVLSISLGFAFLFSDLPALGEVLESTLGQTVAGGIASLSLSAHFEAISRGVLTVEDLLFFCATIALFLGASVRVLEARRHGNARRSARPIGVLVAIYLAVTLGLGPLLGSTNALRFDFTESNLYTLSPGSRAVAENIGSDITLEVYLSEQTAKKSPRFAGFAKHIVELTERFERAATGDHSITVQRFDPAPYTDAEYNAQLAGLVAQDTGLGGTGGKLYFGIKGTNSALDTRRIAFLSPAREQSIEYEIARIVRELGHPERPRVGVLSALSVLEGGYAGTGWQIFDSTRGSFDFVPIDYQAPSIPSDLDVLLVLHPRKLGEVTRKALDAYAVAGGAMLIALDPLAEADTEEMKSGDYTSGYVAERHSELAKLLEAWGVELKKRKVVGDRERGLRIDRADGSGADNYVHYIVLEAEHLAVGNARLAMDPVTSTLGRLTMASAGSLLALGGTDEIEITPLLQSSASSMNLDVSVLQVLKDPAALLADFVEDKQRRNLAIRVRGVVPSAYDNPIPEDRKPINAIIVSDVDIFSDNTWVAEDIRNGVMQGYKATADNGRFFLEAIGDLAGGFALGSIRPKSRYTRPFSVLEELDRLAAEEIARELEVARDRELELRNAKIEADTALAATGIRGGDSRTKALGRDLNEARTSLRNLQAKRDERTDSMRRFHVLLNIFGGLFMAIAIALGIKRMG